MPKGNCVFSAVWLEKEEYKQWIAPAKENKHAFYCKVCKRNVDVRAMGETAVASHAKGKKHSELVKASAPAVPLSDFFHRQESSRKAASTASAGVAVSSFSGSDVLRAEVLWTINTVNKHNSFRSAEENSKLFAVMFPDSAIAANFRCGETKTRYLATFGIGPHFSSLLKSRVKSQTEYVLLFDESLNKELSLKQLDIHVRYWNGNQVTTDYLTSEFLGHAYASTVCAALEPVLTEFGYRQLVQLSMDGPNVNWKVRLRFFIIFLKGDADGGSEKKII